MVEMTQSDSLHTQPLWNPVESRADAEHQTTDAHSDAGTATTAHTVSERSAPVRNSQRPAPMKVAYGVPRLLALPGDTTATAPTAPGDTALVASGDTMQIIEGEQIEGIILVNPASKYRNEHPAKQPTIKDYGMSWVFLGLTILFCIIGIRFKNSKRYIKTLFSDLTNTRMRPNAFDETVKETSLLILLNLLWAASTGVLLWLGIQLSVPGTAADSLSVTSDSSRGIGLCMAVMGGYIVFMYMAYWIVGNVFTDSKHTSLWVKGAAACTALETFVMFPLALLGLTYAKIASILLIIGGAVFILGKIIFIYKGFRIFFAQISSWLLFLYYLCSLEIVPLIFTYVSALLICSGRL